MKIAWTSLAVDHPETRHTVLFAALRHFKGSGCFVGSIPHHLWSDFMSIQEVVDMVHDFNVHAGQLGYDSG